MSDNNQEQGIYINGKKQIIEMLQFMSKSEREKLLGHVKVKNAVMARELSEQSFSFNDLTQLSTHSLRKIFSNINSAIIALALYNASTELQRKVLSSLDRGQAEQAFHIMNQNLNSKRNECKRAQEKVVQIVIQLSRKQQVDI